MRRDTLVQFIAAAVLALSLTASGMVSIALSNSSAQNRLTYADTAEDGDPPEVALGIALGAFRGIFVNALWARAQELKEEGKYHEAVDLARTITRLQPRFPSVWTFHAWNLAYNISVATQTPQERWQWVRAGIELLRNEGIPANPNSILLHKELAWIHIHKVQGIMDDANWYYKREFAREWTIVAGSPPRHTTETLRRDDGSLIPLKEFFAQVWMLPIVEAPDTIEEYYERHPVGRELVQQLEQAGFRLFDRSGSPNRLLEHFEHAASTIRLMGDFDVTPIIEADPVITIFAQPQFQNAARDLIRFVRRRVLIDQYRMEPERMLRYTLEYGPLDWRHPAAHAVYWSVRGSEEALLRTHDGNKRDFDFLNNDRLTIQSIQELFRTGNLFFDIDNPDLYLTLPNLEFIDEYRAVLSGLVQRARDTSHAEAEHRVWSFYQAGYENFLRDAIRYLYRRGDIARAQYYKDSLVSDPNINLNNMYRIEEYNLPLAQFVVNEVALDDRFTSPVVALQEVTGSLEAAFLNGLLRNDMTQYRQAVEYALTFHRVFKERQVFNVVVNRGDRARLDLLGPFELLSARVLLQTMDAVGTPQDRLLYSRAPRDIRGRVYVLMELQGRPEQFNHRFANRPGIPTFEELFPPPEDLAARRMEVERLLRAEEELAPRIEQR